MADERIFHFDVGDSTYGSIGFCAAVRARSRSAALKRLRKNLPRELPIAPQEGAEYIRVYINPCALSTRDIDWTINTAG